MVDNTRARLRRRSTQGSWNAGKESAKERDQSQATARPASELAGNSVGPRRRASSQTRTIPHQLGIRSATSLLATYSGRGSHAEAPAYSMRRVGDVAPGGAKPLRWWRNAKPSVEEIEFKEEVVE